MVDDATLRRLGWSEELIALALAASATPSDYPMPSIAVTDVFGDENGPGATNKVALGGGVVGTQELSLRVK